MSITLLNGIELQSVCVADLYTANVPKLNVSHKICCWALCVFLEIKLIFFTALKYCTVQLCIAGIQKYRENVTGHV